MDTQASEGRWGGGRDDPSCLPLSLSLVGNFVAMGRGRRDPELAGFRLLGGGARWVPPGAGKGGCSGRPADASQPHAAAVAGSRTPQSSRVGASRAFATETSSSRGFSVRVAGTEVPGESSFRSRVPIRGLCRDKLLRVLRSSFRTAERARYRTPLAKWRRLAGGLGTSGGIPDGEKGLQSEGRGRASRVGTVC